MRVLLVTETYAPRVGGGVRYEVDVANHLRQKGHSVDVLTVNAEPRWAVEPQGEGGQGGCVFRAPLQGVLDGAWLSLGVPMLLWRRLREYDVLHFNSPNPIGELAYRICSLRPGRKPLAVCSYHNDVVSAKRFHYLYNRLIADRHIRTVDRVVVSNPTMLETSPIIRRHRRKVRVIPYGVDLTRYPGAPARHRNGSGALSILFVGRLARYKGLDVLLEAMRSAPGRLRIVGQGPLEGQIRSQRAALGLESTVELLGFVPDGRLIQLYADADVLVLPSTDRGEAFGYVLVEAMAMHTAVISTEVGTGTSFVNAHGVTGYVVPPRDAGALAAAIRQLDASPDVLAAFSANARRRAEDEFSVSTMLSRTESVYGEMGAVV